MNIRVARPADIPVIMALEKQTDTAAHWSDETYHSLFAVGSVRRVVLVADHKGGIAGFIVSCMVGTEWEIENLAIDTRLRRQGIASALIQELVARARADDVHQILLEVRESNVSARNFYAKAGFVECRRRAAYYQHPQEDAVCYTLELSPG